MKSCYSGGMIPRNRLRHLFPPAGDSRLSPLVQAADPRNLIETAAGEIRVELGSDWRRMRRALQRVGPVLSVTRNAHAIIGQESPLPEFAGSGQSGNLIFDFQQWRSAWAVHRRRENRNVYSVEWCGRDQEVHHKTCLTPQANLAEFLAWIERHQKSEYPANFKPAFNPAEPLPLLAPGPLIHRGGVEFLLREAISVAQPVQISVGNAAAQQTATFTPTTLSRCEQWCFVGGARSGVHLRTRNLAEVLIQKTPRPAGQFITLKLHDPEARLIAEIAAPENAEPAQWNDFIQRRLVPMPPLPSA